MSYVLVEYFPGDCIKVDTSDYALHLGLYKRPGYPILKPKDQRLSSSELRENLIGVLAPGDLAIIVASQICPEHNRNYYLIFSKTNMGWTRARGRFKLVSR